MATVTVRGTAEAEVEPDRVRIVVAVTAEAADGPAALAGLVERSAAAGAALDATGDLLLGRRPAAVSLQPRWSPTGEVSGQTARRTVVVEARAGGPLGELLARLVDVPGTTVADTAWLVDPGNPAHARLRAAAVADARDRAAVYAEAAGLRLGALEWIAEPGLTRPGDPPRSGWLPQSAEAMARDAGGGGGPVLELRPEPVTVGVEVDVRWALLA